MKVRLWNPVVTSRATSVLSGHKAGIIDLRLRVERKLLLSYSKDAVLKLWDLNNAVIIQTLSLHFPAFSVLGKEIEFGKPGIYLEPGDEDSVLALCCEHITQIRLTEEKTEIKSESDSEDESEPIPQPEQSSGSMKGETESKSASSEKEVSELEAVQDNLEQVKEVKDAVIEEVSQIEPVQGRRKLRALIPGSQPGV
ncbi:uncharacterized protein LOC111696058 [Eurytemora carolleeae]|uniref:uncharacterized protein LOC111696058 n=1 Tax=Eurytemora carolleeae TaxID=1294199 RepID=UPI000C76FB11|nr:uncharacterized protein LOC111696058 [Eurytemora carolleeae]|eukprot:XP_023321349.1 uncharacterized protein LOC111696058 [Eurytemora affinis]